MVSGKEPRPDLRSTEPDVVSAYNKYLRKCYRITAKIRNSMEPHVCAQYNADGYDEDPARLWDELNKRHKKALGLELYFYWRSLFDCTFEAHGTASKYIHEIERIIEDLREANEEVKLCEKTFYLLNGLPPSWREWRDLQATIIQRNKPEDLIAAIKARESTLNRDKMADSTGETVLAV